MTMMPVVAGVDGSEESLRAVEWAAREAQRHAAPLRLVSATAMPPRMRAHGGVPHTVADEMYGESVRALGEAVTRAEEVTSRLLIDASPLAGVPALAVTVSGSGALMLVVGARGAGGFAAMLLGSVSRYAAMHAPCPLVVVREETSAVHREIVVGIGDPLDTSAALAFAFDEADLRGATLVAVHSWNWLTSAGWRPADAEQVAAEADKNLTEALAPWRDKYPDVSVRCDVVRDHPGHVLASYTGRADLVVIGRHGSAVGGIQHALLSHAHGPSLSFRVSPDNAKNARGRRPRAFRLPGSRCLS
jgi:nucleotide-binding universal stress UspA family protein